MTAWFRHVAAAAQLEIQQVLTHPVEWLTAILTPLFWCAVLWFAFNAGTLSELPVALVDLDQSAASRSVVQARAIRKFAFGRSRAEEFQSLRRRDNPSGFRD